MSVLRVNARIFGPALMLFSLCFASDSFAGVPPQESSPVSTGPQAEVPKSTAPLANDLILVSLMPELRPTPEVAPPQVLSPKIQKELSRALDALRSGHLDDARNRLNAAAKIAPSDANLNYARGLLAERMGDSSGARSWWEKSLAIDPSYNLAFLALSHSLLKQGDLDGAEAYLQKARAIDPNGWRPYALLAIVSLGKHSYPESVTFSEHSLELGKSQANGARLTLSEALIALDKRSAAQETLVAFLGGKPPQDQALIAQRLLKSLQSGPDAFVTDSANLSPSSIPSGAKFHFSQLPLVPLGYPTWIPSNIDDFVPPVEAGVACPVQEVLDGAAKNVQQFVKSVDHFTATEALDHQMVDNWGLAVRRETRRFNYVVDISEPRHGFLNVEEYRNGTLDLSQFPDGIATLGLPAIVLLFHPYYRDDYEVSCEGLGSWRDTPAWQFRFIQRPGRPSLRAYRIGTAGPSVSVPLKGRAWIEKRTLQVVRIESDLVAPLPDIRLAAEHQDIEFGPVKFHSLKHPMWLPATADIFFDLRGRKFRRYNSFTGYLLFSVDDKQNISAPKETEVSSDVPATQGDTSKP